MSRGLQLRDLVVGYDTALFAPITIAVPSGSITAVLGPSGSGKSTLLSTVAGIIPALQGTIEVGGRDITVLPIQQRGVGIVFQEPLLFPHRNVIGNIAYGLRRHGASRVDADARARELLAWVGLAGLESRPVHRLSGGQAQRIALARALAPEPAVMLLDEPFSALDVELRSRLVDEVGALLRDRGCASLYVTHDPAEAERIADVVVRLSP